MNWKRIAVFSILLWLTPQLLGFLSGLTMSTWQIYGDTIPEAATNAKMVRYLAIGLACYLVYLLFLRRITSKKATHVFAMFLVVEFISAVTEVLLWAKPLGGAVYWPATARHLIVVTFAIATFAVTDRMSSNNSFKPNPLR